MVATEARIPPSPQNRLISIPAKLDAELVRMRRNPREFWVISIGRCKLCKPKSQTAYDLGHPANEKNAGTWCSEHGWIAFDSVKIRPHGEEYIPKKRKKAA